MTELRKADPNYFSVSLKTGDKVFSYVLNVFMLTYMCCVYSFRTIADSQEERDEWIEVSNCVF